MTSRQYNEYDIVFSRAGVTFTLAFILIPTAVSVSHTCTGAVDFSMLYNDGQIKNVRVDGVSAPLDTETSTPTGTSQMLPYFKQEPFAGENGIIIDNGQYHIQLIPGGRSGSNFIHLFDYETKTWSTIHVYCRPLGLAYRQDCDEIVGFCAVNTTYGPITCVPYFKLRIQNGQWVDVSRSGSCSQPLSTANITNPVILQSDSDYEYDETRLYFAERGTNIFHEVSLSAEEAHSYELDELDGVLKIDHLIPVNATSFYGLRVVCYVDSYSNWYQKLFLWQLDSTKPQQTGFTGEVVVTETIAFDSYNLDYLVTFSANHNTVIIKKDGISKYYPLLFPVDDPIQCQNLVEPSTHYLICLAGNGHLPLLINVTDDTVTNQTISIDKSKNIVRVGMLAEDTFYLLNNQQELFIYLITTTIIYLGPYTVRPNIDFIIITATSDINCSSYNNVVLNNELNSDESHSTIVAAVIAPILVLLVVVTIVIIVIIVFWKRNTKGFDLYTTRKASDGAIVNDETISTTVAQPVSDHLLNSERGAGVDLPIEQHANPVEAHDSGHGTAVNGMSVHYAYMPNSLPMMDLQESSSDPCEGQLQFADVQSVSPVQTTDDNLSIPKLTVLRLDPDGK